jgi:AcrR family transcriptional regulator
VPAVKTHTADLASQLVDAAGRILAAEGAAALTLRRLAHTAGTSTMAVYTLFGDKQGLLAAMYREGYRRLGDAMAAAADGIDDPLEAMARYGRAYRAAALANPHLYDLMFGRPVPAFAPDADAQLVADATFQPLVTGVQRCLDAGLFMGDDAQRIAFHLWAVSHGMVSLELAGHLQADAEEAYEESLVLSSWPFLKL